VIPSLGRCRERVNSCTCRHEVSRDELPGLIYFHEYFHGDNGAGIGASHQTGWTGLVAKLIEQSGKD